METPFQKERNKTFYLFKSHYVVWKHINKMRKMCGNGSLNRTM